MAHTSLTSLFSDTADAIRAKTGSSASIVADDFPTAIAAIPAGLEYETGTYTPASDAAGQWISFAKTHSEAPFFVEFADTGSVFSGTSIRQWAVIDVYKALGAPFPRASSGDGTPAYAVVTGLTRSSGNNSNYSNYCSYSSDNAGDSSRDYTRYWVTESAFKPATNSSTMGLLASRTYKWIAVWKPAT